MTGTMVPLETLGATISAHIAKGDASMEKAEQHYKSAGLHLIEAKERVRQTPGLTWPAFLNAHCKIRRARADELIMIADGRTTLADLRMKKAESVRATRERKKEDLPLRSGESAPVAIAASEEDGRRSEHQDASLLASWKRAGENEREEFLRSIRHEIRDWFVPSDWYLDAAFELHMARGTPVPDELARSRWYMFNPPRVDLMPHWNDCTKTPDVEDFKPEVFLTKGALAS